MPIPEAGIAFLPMGLVVTGINAVLSVSTAAEAKYPSATSLYSGRNYCAPTARKFYGAFVQPISKATGQLRAGHPGFLKMQPVTQRAVILNKQL